MINGFLLGIIATASIASALFFIKFWRHTRDWLFAAFALSFLVEGLTRCIRLFGSMPDEASPPVYGVRVVAFLAILAAILYKNRHD